MTTQPSGEPGELAAAMDALARLFTRAIRALGEAGEPREANVLGGRAWSAIRRTHPHGAQRINGAMHYLAKLEGEGGVGSAGASDTPVVRIMRVAAAPGLREELLRAARTNAEDARATGALSAEVYGEGEEIVVVSRWAARSVLEEFLSWHERRAHESLAVYADSAPSVTHYPLAR